MEVYHRMDNHDRRRKDLGCCGCLEKWFLGSVNFILFVVGIAQVGCGIYAKTGEAAVWTGSSLPNFVIAMGVCVSFIAFLGCCGAYKENKCMLWMYAFFLFWIILAQTAGLTVCAIGNTYTEDFLSDCWDNLSADDQAKIESTYDCCSFNGNSTDATVADQEAYTECVAEHSSWTETCWEKVHGEVEKNLKSITIAVTIVVVSQVIFLFITMALINGITMASVNRKISYFRGV